MFICLNFVDPTNTQSLQGTVIRALKILIHLILVSVLWVRCYYNSNIHRWGNLNTKRLILTFMPLEPNYISPTSLLQLPTDLPSTIFLPQSRFYPDARASFFFYNASTQFLCLEIPSGSWFLTGLLWLKSNSIFSNPSYFFLLSAHKALH